MVEHRLEREILQYLRLLEKTQQMKVLDFVKALIKPAKIKNSGLLELAGTIDKRSLEEMIRAIEGR
ncbi:MAG: hypothetical protein KDD99_05900 [Bacteroidetes bacterium]|nr:hypothetical protein [Bacteroidota bacterium]